MSDSASASTPIAPSPDVVSDSVVSGSVPSAIPPIAPGVKASEAWITLILVILGWLPSSGLLASSPLALQIVGLALSFLSGGHYVAQRSSLKRTYTMAHGEVAKGDTYAFAAATFAKAIGRAAMFVLLIGALASAATLGLYAGCSGTGATLTGDVKAGGDAFLACEKQDVTKYVPGLGVLIAVVATALASGNYADLIANLIQKAGSDAVGCAVVAINAIAVASTTSAATTPTPSASMPIATAYLVQSRAAELMARYGWKIPPEPQSSTTK